MYEVPVFFLYSYLIDDFRSRPSAYCTIASLFLMSWYAVAEWGVPFQQEKTQSE